MRNPRREIRVCGGCGYLLGRGRRELGGRGGFGARVCGWIRDPLALWTRGFGGLGLGFARRSMAGVFGGGGGAERVFPPFLWRFWVLLSLLGSAVYLWGFFFVWVLILNFFYKQLTIFKLVKF